MQGTKRTLGLLSIVAAAGIMVGACSQENTGSGRSGAGDDSAADDDSGSDDDSATDDDSGSDDDSSADDDDSSGSSGSQADDTSDDDSSSSDDDSTGSGGDDDSTGGGSGTGTNAFGMCSGVPLSERAEELTAEDAACVGTQLESEGLPIDIYFLMDRTDSMTYEISSQDGVRRWEYIQGALEDFLTNPDIGDIRVGMGYFNLDGTRHEDVNCDVDNFETPAVPIGEPAEVADDIMAIMDELAPKLMGWTPTAVALEGAINYARSYYRENPDRQTVVAIVTDMYPTMCLVDDVISVQDIADVAAAGYAGDPSIRTFVIGLEANFNLASVARAGGTGEAFLVDEGDDYTGPFVERLRRLSDQAVACNLEIPPYDSAAEEVDPAQVVVTFEYEGEVEEIPRVSDASTCETSEHGGWYYMNDERNTISLCPCTCANIGGGIITVAAGCNPITILG